MAPPSSQQQKGLERAMGERGEEQASCPSEAETPGRGFLDTGNDLALNHLLSASPQYLFDP